MKWMIRQAKDGWHVVTRPTAAMVAAGAPAEEAVLAVLPHRYEFPVRGGLHYGLTAAAGIELGVDLGYSDAVAKLWELFQAALAEYAAAVTPDPADPEQGLLAEHWRDAGNGICASRETGDGRDFSACEWTWRDPEVSVMPLMLQTETEVGHYGAELAGYIETISQAKGTVTAAGRFYDSETGLEFRNMLQGGRRFGVSVDPGAVSADFICKEEDEDGWCIDYSIVFAAYQIIGLTGTPFPAFDDAAIELDPATVESGEAAALATGGEASVDIDPDLTAEQIVEADGQLALHAAYTGVHEHSHASAGDQGGDETHSHPHRHDGDANHTSDAHRGGEGHAAFQGGLGHEFVDGHSTGFCSHVLAEGEAICGQTAARHEHDHDHEHEHEAETAAATASAEEVGTLPFSALTIPARPPRWMFELPEPELGQADWLDGRPASEFLVEQEPGSVAVPLTIREDGLFFGHAAYWGQCHIGYPGQCVSPPESPSGYAHFNMGATPCSDGSRVATGPMVAGCDHASIRMLAPEARDHYAHNGVAWGDARVTAGNYGPWFCGALRPNVTEELFRVLSAGAVSGDWRQIGAGLELITILAVNVGGFGIRREAVVASGITVAGDPSMQVRTENGEPVALVASGIVRRCPECLKRQAAERAAQNRPAPAGMSEEQWAEMRGILQDIQATGRDNAATVRTVEQRTRHLVKDEAAARAARLRG